MHLQVREDAYQIALVAQAQPAEEEEPIPFQIRAQLIVLHKTQDLSLKIDPDLQLHEATPEMLENMVELRQLHDKDVSFQNANFLH